MYSTSKSFFYRWSYVSEYLKVEPNTFFPIRIIQNTRDTGRWSSNQLPTKSLNPRLGKVLSGSALENCQNWSAITLFVMYSQLPSVSGGRLLQPKAEDVPCRGDKGQFNIPLPSVKYLPVRWVGFYRCTATPCIYVRFLKLVIVSRFFKLLL